MTEEEEYLIYLMRGGKVHKIDKDKPKRYTHRQWYRKTRDDDNEKVER